MVRAARCVTFRTSKLRRAGQYSKRRMREIAMRLTTESSNQLQSIFGGGYVLEQHRDERLWNLSSSDVDEKIEPPTVSMFDGVMKSLRSALWLR